MSRHSNVASWFLVEVCTSSALPYISKLLQNKYVFILHEFQHGIGVN
jgi:hypothetical protein